MADQPHSIFSHSSSSSGSNNSSNSGNRGKKAAVLGHADRRPNAHAEPDGRPTSSSEDPADALSQSGPARRAAAGLEANQAQARRLPRHGTRPLTLCFFTVLWLLFVCLFFLPWQLNDRPGWSFSRSVQHDLHNYKEVLKTIVSPASSPPPTLDLGSLPIPTSQPISADPQPEAKMSTEQTFIAIKPDGVQRGLVGPIISRFENRGYKLVALKLVSPSKEHLETHYADLKEKPFFPGLVQYMLSGPICAMVWEGRDAVKTGRTLLGATNPLASAPGTIRGDFAIDVGRNVCHGSDSVENAKKEIALWFKEGEVLSYQSHSAAWIYEKP
ncbi:hypothetical protein JX265_011822 [Neoarthrinium moseri]|uniref:Nucleoside diphosphate kinase n=2 Tax=Neoarthrinium moseri TaxID=1658444 RepID=A0A9Q0AK66_9PEZI|nr:hypothetical protein JX265_011822 [Neoarthrinium moseri]